MMDRIGKTAAVSAAAALLLGSCACKQSAPPQAQERETKPAPLLTIVHAADPNAADQFTSGFYGAEQNAWRWTAGRFSVTLRPPRNASVRGAALVLQGAVPEELIRRRGPVRLSASVGKFRLPEQQFTEAGPCRYAQPVPPEAFSTEAAKVEFSLDKPLAAGEVEQRELGMIVTTIGFEPPEAVSR